MTTEQQEREAFEVWACKAKNIARDHPFFDTTSWGAYTESGPFEAMWQAWQARAALAAQPQAAQEPVAWLRPGTTLPEYGGYMIWKNDGTAFPVFRHPASQAAQAVPDGWKLVPVEPTEAMEQAAADYLDALVKAYGLWEAMLTAAPSAPIRKEGA